MRPGLKRLRQNTLWTDELDFGKLRIPPLTSTERDHPCLVRAPARTLAQCLAGALDFPENRSSSEIFGVSKTARFIIPSAPVLKAAPPSGEGWVHEVKFDGWRAQLHKTRDDHGYDNTRRFRAVRDGLSIVAARSAIIDAEIVVCDGDGKPDFKALMDGATGRLCAWCFDLLELNGRDLRGLPLVKRRATLRELFNADNDAMRYSEEFPDAEKLLAVATKRGLEGIVSKKANQPYLSGKNVGWIKVKTATWREANKDRRELFQR